MSNDDHAPLNNPANLDANPPPAGEADLSGDDYMVFAMQDRFHRFNLGLETILECLHHAEREGAVPRLPESWWLALNSRYALCFRNESG
ncbi:MULTISPECIES: hypothetical protein [unclassified Modicisalibacter]|uniref:hypothetical protein n=1 Tax=unclassified Modicisalibacter TaxID=2679913 RepID=UPI001CCF2193|nr:MULTISPECIES: hypothetical protein [unclassified Modicisalibacter]MBZ9559070.1 hypothetical protein [Modicisalibacter sp. R2A 31.J]MBZ9576819.1 hypothetical protein [Modicisalibacter sp. MOD 31.J]